VSLFVLSPEIEDRDKVESKKVSFFCSVSVFGCSIVISKKLLIVPAGLI
jgi:hypothetical protein